MKYTTFKFNGQCKIGALLDEYLVDVQRAYALYLKEVEKDEQASDIANIVIPNDFVEFLEAGENSWVAAKEAYNYVKSMDKESLGINEEFLFYSLNNVKIQAPIRPKTVICPGPDLEKPEDSNMHKYLEFFLKAQDTVIAHNDCIIKEESVGKINFVPELALVFGKKDRFIDKENILDNVFGYTILNNVYSVDKLAVGWEGTMFHVRYGEGASFDTTAPIGPWIVTKDEIEDPENLIMKKYINNHLIEETNTKDLLRSVKEFVSHCSTFLTMQPEILISTGNPEGPKLGLDKNNRPVVKDLRENPTFLNVGDKVACEIEGIGKIENSVIR